MTAALRRGLSGRMQNVVVLAAVCTMVGCASVAPPPAKPQVPAKQWQPGELIDVITTHYQSEKLKEPAEPDKAAS